MVYARIADRTVADEYFAVSEQVEALYDTAPEALPGDAEGAEMRKLRAEMNRRMLGNGYCARPVGLTAPGVGYRWSRASELMKSAGSVTGRAPGTRPRLVCGSSRIRRCGCSSSTDPAAAVVVPGRTIA